ncbi:MAG: AEC family transporter, partial [Clostridia bacterium]|nr:AEC family transporter [Clostridia bacterium]
MLQLQVLLLMGVGFVLTKLGTITNEGRRSLSDILINFILPCNIICSFQMDLTADLIASCGLVLLLALAAQVLFYAVGHFCYPGQKAERLSCLRYATLCPNAGFLGLPIIGGVFGEMGSLLTSIALLPQRVVMWSAGVSLFTKADSKSVVKKVLTHPCIIAVAIGFALLFAGNPTLPPFLQKTISSAGGCTTCVSMLVI